MRDFTRIAEDLIKNRRWWRVRKKVGRALNEAYKAGRNDAADQYLIASQNIAERMREGDGATTARGPILHLPAPRVSH